MFSSMARAGIKRLSHSRIYSGTLAVETSSLTRSQQKSTLLANDERSDATLKDQLLDWVNMRDDSGVHIHDSFTSHQKVDDLDALVNNFTAPALARALRDRELTLAKLSKLVSEGNYKSATEILKPFKPELLKTPRVSRKKELVLPNLNKPGGIFQMQVLNRIKYRLSRIPREISSKSSKRACIVLPLCIKGNEAHVLFTRRSQQLRRHKGEICFPGGMVDEKSDHTIVQAGLREMQEEIGIGKDDTNVLGIMRLDWVEVKAITGVAVTPVLGYIGDLDSISLQLNPDEVSNVFTVPVRQLVDKSNWMTSSGEAVFTVPDAENHRIWGLTGYVLHRFVKLLPSVVFENYKGFSSENSNV